MAYATPKATYGASKGYNAQTAYKAASSYQPERKKTTQYRGCTCGGNSPCRGTCRTFFTE